MISQNHGSFTFENVRRDAAKAYQLSCVLRYYGILAEVPDRQPHTCPLSAVGIRISTMPAVLSNYTYSFKACTGNDSHPAPSFLLPVHFLKP